MNKLGTMILFFFLMQGCFEKKEKKLSAKAIKESPHQWINSKAGKKICVKVSKTSKKKKMMPLQECIKLGIGEYKWVNNDFGVKSCVYSVNEGISNPMPINLCEQHVKGWLGGILGH